MFWARVLYNQASVGKITLISWVNDCSPLRFGGPVISLVDLGEDLFNYAIALTLVGWFENVPGWLDLLAEKGLSWVHVPESLFKLGSIKRWVKHGSSVSPDGHVRKEQLLVLSFLNALLYQTCKGYLSWSVSFMKLDTLLCEVRLSLQIKGARTKVI